MSRPRQELKIGILRLRPTIPGLINTSLNGCS